MRYDTGNHRYRACRNAAGTRHSRGIPHVLCTGTAAGKQRMICRSIAERRAVLNTYGADRLVLDAVGIARKHCIRIKTTEIEWPNY